MTGAERAAQHVYEELLTRVGEANPRPRIEPVRRLAELAGSPQLSFPVIQVAGTNGKTSTSRAIESLLRAHGLRTGLFTSPHLVDFTERFQLDGAPVGGNVLAEAWDELRLPLEVLDAQLEAEGQGPITFFEALAVLAFAIFADAPVDVAVIEVGMGGEWDATNIADAQVAVFTPIDLDHTAVLGDDIETIARTKAGIVKESSTVVSAQQTPEAIAQIVEAAEREDARLFVSGRDFALLEDRLAVGGRQVMLRGLHGHEYDPVFVPLYGGHQAQNVSLAVAAVEAFFGAERPIPEEVLGEGLGQLVSPGRLQLIGNDPVVYVDAAHNPHGAAALAAALAAEFSFTRLVGVLAVLGDKDVHGILEALADSFDEVVVTRNSSPRSMPPAELAALAEDVFGDGVVHVAERMDDAIALAVELAETGVEDTSGTGVVITGSVVSAGDGRALAGLGPA